MEKEKVFMVIHDDGFTFHYSFFKSFEGAKKEWERLYKENGFDDYEEGEIERVGEYQINDIYGGDYLKIKEVEVNP